LISNRKKSGSIEDYRGCVEIFVFPELLPDFQKFVIRQKENYF